MIPIGILGLVAYPSFYFLFPKTEILWLDMICTLACIVLLLVKRLSFLKLHYLYLYWYFFLILCFPFNFTYNLFVNPHNTGYELGEMIMLITIFSIISDTVLIIILQSIGIGLAVILFFLHSGRVFIPTDVQATIPWYILGMVLGLILSHRRNSKVKEERIDTKNLEQEKASLAFLSRKDSIREAILAVAHELNQPLSAVQNYTRGCQRRLVKLYGAKLPPEVNDGLTKSAEQAQRAGNIIHTLKDLLCEEDLKGEMTSINILIHKVVRLMNETIIEAKVNLQLKLEANLPELKCNPTQLELVLVNLLKNACESIVEADNNKRSIIIKTAQASSSTLIVSITDSGLGITPDISKKLFNPFVSTKEDGVGLGLSLSYNIIQRHGGSIKAQPAPHQGAIFEITLPLS
jgi:signal transduction histidine kinase